MQTAELFYVDLSGINKISRQNVMRTVCYPLYQNK